MYRPKIFDTITKYDVLMKHLHFYSLYPKMQSENPLLSYKGPIDYETIADINHKIETKLPKSNPIGYKVFSIILELNQNLMNYSDELNYFNNMNSPVGRIDLIEKKHHLEYLILSHNLVSNEKLVFLEDKIKKIANLDVQTLRKYKIKQRREADSFNKRAGIGLTQIAILSENSLSYEIKKMNESYSLFTLKIKISSNHKT